MEISMGQIKELRERTGAGVMSCKKALSECEGDMEAATERLRKENLAQAAKRSGRSTTQGLIESYIHPGSRLGVLIEVNCETDFVARTDDFQSFVHDLAMQIAASRPISVTREGVPAEVLEHEKEIYREQARNEGKTEEIATRVAEGRLKKFYQEACLLEQVFVKDLDKTKKRTVEELLQETMGRLGENIVVKRFERFELGGD